MPAPSPAATPPWLERAVLLHAGALAVFTAWAYGGQAPWVREALRVGGSVGFFLLFFVARELARRHGRPLAGLRWLWPLLVFDVVAVAACFNPTFQPTDFEGEPYFVRQEPPFAWLPTSALPGAALAELWLLNGLVVTAHNLVVVSSRRALRTFLSVLAANAVLLAIFGSFQKLTGADGLWFGAVPSPNEFFFASFIYHNHWGSFVLLHTAIATGLLLHHYHRHTGRDVWHSPVPAGAVATLVLAATAPLSGSRSSSVLVCLFLLAAAAHFALTVARSRRAAGRSAVPPVAALGVAVLVGAAGIAWLAKPIIERRARDTIRQVGEIRSESPTDVNARLALYRDTWRMASDRPWFGWGLESYAHVFQIYNTQRPVERVFRQRFYAEAHNDWLQSLAETGFVGTGLLVLLGLLPVAAAPWLRASAALPRYLLAATGAVLLYAWVEFPFANPAVILAFWTALYVAARYAQLDSRSRPVATPSPHG